MKKLLVLFLLCFPVLLYAKDNKNEINLKLGITPSSVLNYREDLSTENIRLGNLGLMLTTEYFRKYDDLLFFGIGFSQQFDRAISENDGSLYFTSLYLAQKIDVYQNLYFMGQIGASFINSNQLFGGGKFDRKKPGMYYGVGTGYVYHNFIFEFLYSINQASYEYDLAAYDNTATNQYYIPLERRETYQTFNFNIGYKFNF
jgi:hypothetical protein